jgi:pyruvate/2-oxoglutarate dehydrogenase complex dihydrolipoamide acyltransferase (E2) component
MKFEMKMPDLAATDSAIKILNWLIEVGDPVRQGQAVIEVETDKATMEVEATVNGTLVEKKCDPNTEISPDSAAYTAGMRPGDVIVEINHKPISNAQDAIAATQNPASSQTLVKVWSNGGSRYLTVDESGQQ